MAKTSNAQVNGTSFALGRSEVADRMEKLIKELQAKIVDVLNLIGVQPDDIKVDSQLVGGDLGIDSIDVLEMVIMIEKDYSVKIDNRELGVKVFATLGTLAEYIHKNSPELSN